MSNLISIIITLIALVINIIAISHSAYENKKLTCNRYVLNTYLYLILAILIIVFMIVLNSNYQLLEETIPFMYESLLGFIVQIFIIFALFFYFATLNPTKNKIQIHIVWVLIMVFLGILLYPVVLINNYNNNMGSVLGVTLSIMLLTGFLGNKYGDYLVRFDWDKYLYTALILSVILSVILLFTGQLNDNFELYFTVVVLIIFVLLLISYNKKLVENSKTCLEHNNPNYLQESLGLFTKIMNVFVQVSKLMGRRRR
jgi:hypothetical protein